MEERKSLSIFQVNQLYLVLAIVFINIGAAVQGIDLNMGLLFTEYVIIFLPNLILLLVNRVPMKKFLRLNKISLKQILLVIVITLFTYPLAVFAQAIFLTILDTFTEFAPNVIPVADGPGGFLFGLFVMAISPGICEEFMFRGVILNAYDKMGYKKSIVITALLFAVFHFNIVNFVGPFILGIVFGIMVYKTNSLYSAMIGHGINNSIAFFILYFVDQYADVLEQALESEPAVTSTSSILASAVIGFLFLILCFVIVKKAFKSLGEIPKEDIEVQEETVKIRQVGNNTLKYLPIGIVVIMFFYMNFKYIVTLR